MPGDANGARTDVPELVTVFGGSGFVGRHIVRCLASRGARIRVAVRDPEAGMFLKSMGEVGQIELMQANLRDDASVAAAVAGVDAVVVSVGLLYESGKQTFNAIHVDGMARVAQAAQAAGVSKLVQISAIGADVNSESRYGRTKAEGEQALRDAFPDAVILRPSIIFGPEDGFFNQFGAIAALSPVLPIFAGDLFDRDGTRFQPVYVGDVAQAVFACLDGTGAAGQSYDLGGPQVYTWRELMEMVTRITERRRVLMPVLLNLAAVMAFFLEFWPAPLLTRDQLRQLANDNVAAEGAAGLAELGVAPTPAGSILPSYLARYRSPGKHSGLQTG